MEIRNYFASKTQKTSGFNTLMWIRSRVSKPIADKSALPAGVLGVAVAFLLCGFFQKAHAWAQGSPRYHIPCASLKIEALPEWLSPYASEIAPAGLPEKVSIFAPGVTGQIADAYLGNPWVKKVLKVCKRYPNRVSVQLLLRRPVAWVCHAQCYFLVDVQGVRLPGEYSQPPASPFPVPVITGVEGKVPVPGEIWQDVSLQRALPVVEALQNKDALKPLALNRIHLEAYPDESNAVEVSAAKKIVLISENSLRVVWGSPCHSLHLRYVTFEKRLDALLQLGRMLSQSDVLRPPKVNEVDLRFGYLIVKSRGDIW